MVSTFFNDMYAFDMERRRWYQLGLKQPKAEKSSAERKAAKAAKFSSSSAIHGNKKAGDRNDNSDDDNDDEAAEEESDEDGEEEEDENQPGGDDTGVDHTDYDQGQYFGFIDENGNVSNENDNSICSLNCFVVCHCMCIRPVLHAMYVPLLQVVYVDLEGGEDGEGKEGEEASESIEGESKGKEGEVIIPSAVEMATAAIESTATETVSKEFSQLKIPSAPIAAPIASKAFAAGLDSKPAASNVEAATVHISKYFSSRSDPSPRINPCLMVRGNSVIIYGGVVELGDIEVTLDDCW